MCARRQKYASLQSSHNGNDSIPDYVVLACYHTLLADPSKYSELQSMTTTRCTCGHDMYTAGGVLVDGVPVTSGVSHPIPTRDTIPYRVPGIFLGV